MVVQTVQRLALQAARHPAGGLQNQAGARDALLLVAVNAVSVAQGPARVAQEPVRRLVQEVVETIALVLVKAAAQQDVKAVAAEAVVQNAHQIAQGNANQRVQALVRIPLREAV